MSGRPATPLHWPDLREPAGPPSDAERLSEQLAVLGQAYPLAISRAFADVWARLDALEQRDAPPAADAEYVTTTVAARLLGVSPKTVARWAREKRVTAHDLNGWRVRRADLDILARYRAGGQ